MTTDPLDSLCACLLGDSCGWCSQKGQHERCAFHAHAPHESPAAYLCARRRGVVLAAVWEAGHRHGWVCQCHRDGHGAVIRQLDLFALEVS